MDHAEEEIRPSLVERARDGARDVHLLVRHDYIPPLLVALLAGIFEPLIGEVGDPVLAETQDGSGTDNTTFSTPPDGMSGRMQMYIFDFPTPARDDSLVAYAWESTTTDGFVPRAGCAVITVVRSPPRSAQ